MIILTQEQQLIHQNNVLGLIIVLVSLLPKLYYLIVKMLNIYFNAIW